MLVGEGALESKGEPSFFWSIFDGLISGANTQRQQNNKKILSPKTLCVNGCKSVLIF